ncbi:zinc finger and SCAN domain-containing protein 2-like isoform X1 [Hippocampus comes]|nr:PREDICTED: zinc finger and SCAN domain-containing protein 2-like isoform X1 [Hippocampus comes]
MASSTALNRAWYGVCPSGDAVQTPIYFRVRFVFPKGASQVKMCKVEMLRAMLNARLSAAVEEIFGVVARTIAEYEEELSRTKEENERQRQLLDAVFRPQEEPHKTDNSEESLPLEQQEPEPPQDQGEEGEADPFLIKEETEREPHQLLELPFSRVIVKSEYDEDKSQSVESRGAEPPSSSSSQHVTTEGDGGRRGASQADCRLAPQSHSRSPDSDAEHPKSDMTCHPGNAHWKCSQCDKTFGTKYTLRVHMMIHSGDKPFMCSVCGKRFSQKAHLTTHTRIHTGDKPYSCSVCNKSFIDYSAMIKHTRVHTGEKPFACSVCNLSFSDRSNLGKHMRRHTGEKPFACSLCGKRFSIRGHLTTHTRTHTGEKPFTCAICNLNFSDRSGLVQHRRTHTGEKRFTCSICGKQFSQRGAFTKHIQIHSGEKPLSCSV